MHGNADIVLFLGAGFSRDAGLPIMTGFADESQRELEALRELMPNRKAARDLVNAGEAYTEFHQWLSGADGFLEAEIDNVENVICAAEALRESNIPHLPNFDGPKTNVAYIQKMILWWLWKVYQQCPPLAGRGVSDPYYQLADAIKGCGAQERVTLITTNYDLIAEYFFDDAGLSLSYPIRTAQSLRIGIEQGGQFVAQGDGGEVRVCKLHGSVNYFSGVPEHGEYIAIADSYVTEGMVVGESRVPRAKSSRHPDRRPSIFPIDAISAIHKYYGGDVVPAIIPPTYAKLHGQPWLKEVWTSAFNALKQARLILFIGYSMPPSDGFVRSLLTSACAARSSKLPLQIGVADPSESVRDRFCRLFRHIDEGALIDDGFADGAKRVCDLIRTHVKNVPTEKLAT